MKARLSHMLPVALMLLLAAMTLWLRFTIETAPDAAPGKNRHDPDAIVEKVTISRMDEQGIAKFHLSATHMVHFPDNDSMELTAPVFSRKDAKADLTVTADRAIVNQEIKEARMHENVTIVRRPTGDKEALSIRSEYMQVFMESEVARTDRPVVIINGSSTLSGTGMEFEGKTGRLSLQSGVKGTFHGRK